MKTKNLLQIPNISFETSLVFLISYLGVISGSAIISAITTISLLFLAIYWLNKNDYYNFFVILMVSSYQTAGYNIYNYRVIGFSFIYIIVLLLIIKNWRYITLRKSLLRYFPLFLFIPYYFINGLFNNYGFDFYLKDILRFISFFLLIPIFYNNRSLSESFMDALKSYIFIILPISFLFYLPYSWNVSLGNEKGIFFDESASLFVMTCIFFSIYLLKQNRILIVVIFSTIILRLKYYYFSSIELLGLFTLALTTLISKNVRLFWSFLFISTIIFLCLPILKEYLPNFTVFKFQQVAELLEILLYESNISLLPFSPKIRILESIASFKNLQAQGVMSVLFGNGFGSFFSYDFNLQDYGITTLFDTGSYPEDQINANKYFTAHNTIPFLIIKTGILGPLIFLRLSLLAIKSFLGKRELKNLFIPIFALYILMNLGYGMKNFILISFMISYLIQYIKGLNYEM